VHNAEVQWNLLLINLRKENKKMRKLIPGLIILVVVFFSSGICLAAPILTIETATILVGQTTTIDVSLSGNPTSGTGAAATFDFTLPYNSTQLTPSNLASGSAVSGLSGFNFLDASTPGNIIAFTFSSAGTPPVMPNSVIAHFDITGLLAGIYSLNFSDAGLYQSNGDDIIGGFSTVQGTLTVNPVPIPAAVWLLGSGVVGIVALKRRKEA
jgi:hypothetical protein